ncbi:MAG: class I SAM-dependent methyltransferase [Acidobacteria bacterium]|nr:class I SAM-dependent methyltransferase [Acidobacteriota bacterium]
MMDVQEHWDHIYQTKESDQVSWYAPHLNTSLDLIQRTGVSPQGGIIDVGGGESTLVDDLLIRGYKNITVLDISRTAIDANKRRLRGKAENVCWVAADITNVALAPASFDVWHDRAVFHFLTASGDREAYIRQIEHALKPDGHVIIGAFGPEGPTKCSGLEVARYDAASLHHIFGRRFRLVESRNQAHKTPLGVTSSSSTANLSDSRYAEGVVTNMDTEVRNLTAFSSPSSARLSSSHCEN